MKPKAPRHLSPEAAKWWQSVMNEFSLEPYQQHLLRLCCEALDRGAQARAALEEAGTLTFDDGRGMIRQRPEVLIEASAALRVAKLMKALGIDQHEGQPGPGRPPGAAS